MDADAWDDRYRAQEYVWTTEANRFLVDETADLPTGRALDLATGEGRNAVWLAERGWHVTAVDFSAGGLEKARRLADDRAVSVDWMHADVVAWQPPGLFDLVVLLYLQLPLDPRRLVTTRGARALAPGGTLLVVAHARENLEHGCGGPQDVRVLWDAAETASWLAGDGGLEIERAETVERPVETDDGNRTALDVLVRVHRTPA